MEACEILMKKFGDCQSAERSFINEENSWRKDYYTVYAPPNGTIFEVIEDISVPNFNGLKQRLLKGERYEVLKIKEEDIGETRTIVEFHSVAFKHVPSGKKKSQNLIIWDFCGAQQLDWRKVKCVRNYKPHSQHELALKSAELSEHDDGDDVRCIADTVMNHWRKGAYFFHLPIMAVSEDPKNHEKECACGKLHPMPKELGQKIRSLFPRGLYRESAPYPWAGSGVHPELDWDGQKWTLIDLLTYFGPDNDERVGWAVFIPSEAIKKNESGHQTRGVPLTVIREHVRLEPGDEQYWQFDTEVDFYSGLEFDERLMKARIRWGEDEEDGQIPPGIAEQLVGQPVGPAPLQIMLRGEKYIVVAIIIERGNDEYYIPPSGECLSKDDKITQLWVVNAKFIDLNA